MKLNRLFSVSLVAMLFIVPLLFLGLGWLVWNGVYAPRLPSNRNTFNLGMVHYNVPMEGAFSVQSQMLRDKDYIMSGDDYNINVYHQDLRQLGGHLYYNGLFYGSVHPQQTVLITDRGQVFINGQERLPRMLPRVAKR